MSNNRISISVTIGGLDDALKNFDNYGLFLRGFRTTTGEVEDEPEKDLETVLTLNLTVLGDLEPVWTLISDQAKAQHATRNLTWTDRVPTISDTDRRFSQIQPWLAPRICPEQTRR